MREPGSVFHYPYRWRNRTEDHPKDRTVTLAIVVKDAKAAPLTHLFLLAITDNPDADGLAVEIPPIERRRAGLSPTRPAFVVISEYNYDILPLSHRYNPNAKTFGAFSPVLTEQVRDAFLDAMRRARARRVDRTVE
ncbi:MAG: hypothetical protein ACKVON_17640 [Beijerinckiaceae bacterium]